MNKNAKKQVKEDFLLYDMERSEKRTFIVPKLGDGEEKVHFDSTEAEMYLRRCMEPMITEAKKHIMEQVDDHKYFVDFPACGLKMKRVFIENFALMLYVERFKDEGESYLSLLVIEPEASPIFQIQMTLRKDGRDGLIAYLNDETFQEDFVPLLKQIMISHREKLLELRG